MINVNILHEKPNPFSFRFFLEIDYLLICKTECKGQGLKYVSSEVDNSKRQVSCISHRLMKCHLTYRNLTRWSPTLVTKALKRQTLRLTAQVGGDIDICYKENRTLETQNAYLFSCLLF